MQLTFRPVTKDRWPDFEALFDGRGAPKPCWCMLWRPSAPKKGSDRKEGMRNIIASDTPVGLLAYLEDAPVAWCSIAPRETYRQLGGIEEPGDGENPVWSLACMFIKREMRGRRHAEALIEAAVAYARSNGAAVVEAYPVDPESLSYRFMGFLPLFLRLGFRKVGSAGSRRHVVRLPIDGLASA